MKEPTRLRKEAKIIDASIIVFEKLGFKKARMKDIAEEANITKVTLYSYFQSKDNLYMAVTHRALKSLISRYEEITEQSKDISGLELTINLLEEYMDFCENNYLYSETMLEYFTLIRSTSSDGKNIKLAEGLKESFYFNEVKKIHNKPFKISALGIQKGIEDKSISAHIDPMLHTLYCWTVIVGYVKILAASGDTSIPIFKLSLADLKALNLNIARSILTSKVNTNLEIDKMVSMN